MLSMINRGRIKDLAVIQEFEHLISRLRGFLSQSFDEDGALIVADPNLAVMPVGGMTPYGGSSAPAGWALCNGAQLNRVTYKSLFDVIGTSYGVGDGSTTFNVPDLRQRFPLGKAAAGTGVTIGSTGGVIDHTHTGPSHTHTTASHTHSISSSGSHTHDLDVLQNSSTATGTAGGVPVDNTLAGSTVNVSVAGHAHYTVSPGSGTHSTNSGGDHSHGGNTGGTSAGDTGSSGTGATGTNNPPYQVVNYIIFAGV